MKHIQLRIDLYNGRGYVPPTSCYSFDNPTIQNLDTSVLSLIKGIDECGKVNNLQYSEDDVVNVYGDSMEMSTQTQHELDYYQGLTNNIIENQTVATENAVQTSSESATNEVANSDT